MQVWRLVRKRRLKDAFTGEGARLAGGRWNSPGTSVIYTSSTQALAQLEYLVHANATRAPHHVLAIAAEIPDDLRIDELDLRKLPKNWRRYDPPVEELRALGDKWLRARSAPVLRVPSAVIPEESNYMLNPAHPDFGRILRANPIPVHFDQRLIAEPGRKQKNS